MPACEHEKWMKLALTLARQGEGLTRPNPPVGAVIVHRGRMIGQGLHRRAGAPHAEALALAAAGDQARGATLYVTLEPCCTSGRTPPCTDAILAAGIKTVVAGVRDPNPRHQGRGLKILRRAGLNVIEDVCRGEAEKLIAPFAQWVRSSRPYLTLKMAESLDGKIADRHGKSRWITGVAARRAVQALRRRADAILVGANTVRMDNPGLLPQPACGRRPWRVIVDSCGALSGRAEKYKIFQAPDVDRTIIAATKKCPAAICARARARGAQVWILPASQGRVSLPALMRRLGRLGILHVMCEGGGELAAALIKCGLIDEYVFFLAPRVIGGRNGAGAAGGAGWPLRQAPELKFTDCRHIGADVMLRAIPKT